MALSRVTAAEYDQIIVPRVDSQYQPRRLAYHSIRVLNTHGVPASEYELPSLSPLLNEYRGVRPLFSRC